MVSSSYYVSCRTTNVLNSFAGSQPAGDVTVTPAGDIGSPPQTGELSPTPTASTTSPISSTSSTGTPTPSDICPDANNTVVSQDVGSTKYRILCDSDFSGSGKETLASVVLPSFDSCLGLCNTMNYFQKRDDVGCTYNTAGTGSQTPGTCWCLGGADKEVVTNVGNVIAKPL
jgi:hypothetical protein